MNKPDQNSKPAFSGERVRLGDVCAKGKSSLRQKDLRNDGPYVVFGASGIAGTSASYQNESPYVAVVKDGAGVGRARICQEQSSVLGTMQALIPNERITCKYLLHLVRSMKLGEGFSGSTIPHIYFKDYSEREVVVPALDDQEKITSTLDKIENLIDGEKTTITHLQSLVKSRFVEMFGDGRCFQKCKIGDLVCGIVSGTNVSGKQRPLGPGEFGVLKISSVTKGVFDSSEFKVVSDPNSVRKMIYPRKGDLLFSRANTSEMIGATAIVDNDYDQLFLPDKLWRLDPSRNVDTIFLKQLLSSKQIRATLSKISTGTSGSMQNISMSKFRSVDAYLPPLPLQREFAAFAEQAAKLEFVAQQQIEKLQTLYDSLAQEYFG